MNWLHYLLEANLYLTMFYIGYCLVLNKETYYSLNRAYLLLSCVLAFVLPFMQLGFLKHTAPVVQTQITAVNFMMQPVDKAIIAAPALTPDDYILYLYITGAVILLLVFLFKLYRLLKMTGSKTGMGTYKVVHLNGPNTAFSFFNYLFIGNNMPAADTIIKHELVHMRQKHSADIIFIELLKIVNWFNPFIYLLQISLKAVHEYIADEETASDVSTYSTFLVNNAYGLSGSSITHSFFNYNLLKRRIIMLHQKRSGNLARLKYLMAVPLCAALLCASTLAFSKTYGFIDLAPAKSANTESAARFGYTINPALFNENMMRKIGAAFYERGYAVFFAQDKDGDILKVSLQKLHTGPAKASAIFSLSTLKQHGEVIYIGYNLDDKNALQVCSQPKEMGVESGITDASLIQGAPIKKLVINDHGNARIADDYIEKLADGTTHRYTPQNLSDGDKAELAKKGVDVRVISDAKIDSLPAPALVSAKQKLPQPKVVHMTPPPPPAGPGQIRVNFPQPNPYVGITGKGYRYAESGYESRGVRYIKVDIMDKDTEREWFQNAADADGMKILKDKYGFTFVPMHGKLLPPPPIPPKVEKAMPPPPPVAPKAIKVKRLPPPVVKPDGQFAPKAVNVKRFPPPVVKPDTVKGHVATKANPPMKSVRVLPQQLKNFKRAPVKIDTSDSKKSGDIPAFQADLRWLGIASAGPKKTGC